MKTKRMLSILCGVMLMPAAFAAGPVRHNPVIDISSLEQTGLYRTTSITTSGGVAEKPDTGTECVTPAEVHDFLNSEASGGVKVTSWKLDGHHLHVKGYWMARDKEAGTITYDLFFDSPTESHGIMKMAVRMGAIKDDMTIKLKAHRIGACKKDRAGG